MRSLLNQKLSIILVGDTDAASLERSLVMMLHATGLLNGVGQYYEFVVVVDERDRFAIQMIESTPGLRAVTSVDTGDVRSAFTQGIDATDGPLLWMSTASALLTPEAILWWLAAIEPNDVAMSVPDKVVAQWAVVRRSSLDSIGGLGSLTLAGGAPVAAVINSMKDAFVSQNQRVAHRLEPVTGAATGAAVFSPGFEPNRIWGGPRGSICVGPHTYTAGNSAVRKWFESDVILVGDYNSISLDVSIVHPGGGARARRLDDGSVVSASLPGSHHPEFATTFPIELFGPDSQVAAPDWVAFTNALTVGSDVWMGYGASISGGVNVGSGSIIGGGAVVTRDVAPYSVVSGNPATVVRKRFSDEVIEALLRIRWWDWPIEVVRSRWEWFAKPINEFVERFDQPVVTIKPESADVADSLRLGSGDGVG